MYIWIYMYILFAQQSLYWLCSRRLGVHTVPLSWGFELPRGFRPKKRWPNHPATIQNSSKYQLAGFNSSLVVYPLKCLGPTRSFVQGHITKKHLLSGSTNCNKTSWLNYIKYKYLEPKSPLFLKINPPKQGLFPTTSAIKGFQVSIHIISSRFINSFFSKLTRLKQTYYGCTPISLIFWKWDWVFYHRIETTKITSNKSKIPSCQQATTIFVAKNKKHPPSIHPSLPPPALTWMIITRTANFNSSDLGKPKHKENPGNDD